MKNKTNKTVLEYIKKNPVITGRRIDKYMKSKKSVVWETEKINDYCFIDHIVFPDLSCLTVGFGLYVSDDDVRIVVFKFVLTEDEEWNNEVKYTEEDLDNVS